MSGKTGFDDWDPKDIPPMTPESVPVLSTTDAMIEAVESQNLYHGRYGTVPAGRATALAILSGLRSRGFALTPSGAVSGAEPEPAEVRRWGISARNEIVEAPDAD
jgi:hypothetical protein